MGKKGKDAAPETVEAGMSTGIPGGFLRLNATFWGFFKWDFMFWNCDMYL